MAYSDTGEYIQIIVNVDMQEGGLDCGLLALVNIMAVLNRVDHSVIKYDQKQMWQCIFQEVFKPGLPAKA